MAYIGNTLQNQNYVPAIDYFNGDGSTVAFTLSRPVASVAAVQAVISNVPQNPGSAFTVSGSTITFTSAPPSGTSNIYVYYTSPNTQVVQPGQGTVMTTSIADGSVTPAKLSTGAPTWDVYSNLAVSSSTTANGFTSYSNSADGGVQGYIGTSKAICSTGANSILGVRGESGIILGVGNTERMRIDSGGRVTMPYQPTFRVYNSANLTVTSDYIKFDTAAKNVGSCYNASTGLFTAPVAGTYQFNTTLLMRGLSDGSGPWEPQLKLNGSSVANIGRYYYRSTYTGEGGYLSFHSSLAIYMSANDTIGIYNGNTATYHSDLPWTNFTGFLLG